MELTEKQQELYEYMNEHKSVELVKLARALYDYDTEEQIGEWRNRHSIGRIREDVIAINRSTSQYKIAPIKKGKALWGYKLADSLEELKHLRSRYRRSGIAKLLKARDFDIAIKNNGQVRINGKLDPVEIKAYIEEVIDEELKKNG